VPLALGTVMVQAMRWPIYQHHAYAETTAGCPVIAGRRSFMDCRRSFTGGPAIARSWAGVARSWAAVARALASVALSQAAVALFSPLVQGWLCGGGVLQWHPPVCLILFYFIFF